MGPEERRHSASSDTLAIDSHHEPVDPRVKLKLDQLNQLTYTINQLEKRIEECNQSFQKYLSDSSDELKALAGRVGPRSVAEARPYYEARDAALACQKACQRAAMEFERQSEAHQLAREYMTITESRSHNQICHRGAGAFDAAWQTMLNDATIKLLDTERKRDKCQEDHEACMKRFAEAESSAATLESQHPYSIKRAKPYFDFATKVHASLEERKTEIESLNALLVEAKERYAETMRDLEEISEQIHQTRRESALLLASLAATSISISSTASSSTSSQQQQTHPHSAAGGMRKSISATVLKNKETCSTASTTTSTAARNPASSASSSSTTSLVGDDQGPDSDVVSLPEADQPQQPQPQAPSQREQLQEHLINQPEST